MEVTLFPGAGTLANDAVAANLKAIFGDRQGLILSNGEFGNGSRTRRSTAGLGFRQLKFSWGAPWTLAAIEDALDRRPAWIWAVHLETSTGVLNDMESLLSLAADAKSAVALDCVSSLGATPIVDEAESLLLASGVSGKSLGSYAGLGFVYLSSECRRLLANKVLCPSFDLLRMHQTCGPQRCPHPCFSRWPVPWKTITDRRKLSPAASRSTQLSGSKRVARFGKRTRPPCC